MEQTVRASVETSHGEVIVISLKGRLNGFYTSHRSLLASLPSLRIPIDISFFQTQSVRKICNVSSSNLFSISEKETLSFFAANQRTVNNKINLKCAISVCWCDWYKLLDNEERMKWNCLTSIVVNCLICQWFLCDSLHIHSKIKMAPRMPPESNLVLVSHFYIFWHVYFYFLRSWFEK